MTDAPAWRLPIGRAEFIAIMAALIAINALAIDVMLPGMQVIGAALGEADENRRQLVVTAYLVGFGLGQLPVGPLSDRLGRLGPLLAGVAIYTLAAGCALFVDDFATLLALRFVQGAGAASTRALTMAITRDVAAGRAMAEIMSLVTMVFMIMPIVAPALGQVLLMTGSWRLVFAFMAGAGLIVGLWTFSRIPETLARENRRPFTFASLLAAAGAVLGNRVAVLYTLATTLIFAALFGFINSAQQIYVGHFGLGALFPAAFAAVAVTMAAASFLNSRLVRRFGMRRLSHGALIGFLLVSAVLFVLARADTLPFPLFIGLFAAAMFAFGLIGANFSAIAMEPLGHVAGMAASVQGTVQTVFSALAGAVIGQAYDGTLVPITAGYLALSASALVLVLAAEKGRLFGSGAPR